MGVVAAGKATRAELLSVIQGAESLARVEERYEGVIISRVTTKQAGDYWLVTEADVLFPEDIDALERLEDELGGRPWRARIVRTTVYNEPHKLLPLSSSYEVHLVHQACPFGVPRRSAFG